MQSTRLHTGWQFSRDRETWTEVSVPHDWAAGADFSIDNDPSAKKVAEDGTVTYGHTGRTGGLPIVGEGWYRYTFARPDADVVRFLFDGVMTESDISVNGVRVANGHSGYFPILADATNAVRDGDNVLEVHAKVPADSARWYSGAGIIRNVHMLTGPATHMLTDGIRVVVNSDAHRPEDVYGNLDEAAAFARERGLRIVNEELL